MRNIQQLANCIWYEVHGARWLLRPFSWIYQLGMVARSYYLRRYKQHIFSVPVIIVGNITVGGVGKTPVVIALANALHAQGLRVGIISRGYGASTTQFPYTVFGHEEAHEVGDEPLLLAQKTPCSVVIDPNRVRGVTHLIKKYHSEVIISDDGLQHYQLGRSLEIVIVDGKRGIGNGLCLPAGPLREPRERIRQADMVVINGDMSPALLRRCQDYQVPVMSMRLVANELEHLKSGTKVSISSLPKPIAAVAGIGNPGRFFATLAELNISFKPYVFNDHHSFSPNDFQLDEKSIIMTEKDAVKCISFSTDKMYFLPVTAQIEDQFWEKLWIHKALQS